MILVIISPPRPMTSLILVLKEALKQAKKARLEILDVIAKQISEPRKEVSKYAH